MSAGDRLAWAAGAAAALGLGLLVAPLYLVAVASVSPEARLFASPPLWPDPFVLDHYRALFDERRFWLPLRNSFAVAATTTLLCVLLGSLCAYALARMRFRGRGLLLAGVLAVSMFPQIAIVSPLYQLLRSLGWIDTLQGLVFPYLTFALPLTVWMLVGYFRQLPAELEEAAAVDGAGRLRVLAEVVLPLALPGLAATAILTFVYCWNEFLFALSFSLGPDTQTVPVAIALFRGRYQVPWGQVLAAALVATAPVTLLVLALQRRIVQGLTAGAVKG